MINSAPSTIESFGDRASCLPGKEPVVEPIPGGMREPWMPKYYCVSAPVLGGKEKEYVLDCLETNWISSQGSYIKKFEEAFAAKVGSRYGVATTSGTTALHLALHSLGISPGDEVIIPTFTMIAVPNMVAQCGAKPVLVDVDAQTCNIDVKLIEEQITKKTKALIPVHTYGYPVEMDEIHRIAQKHNLLVIEDAAEAHGALYKGQPVGSFGDASCFSFYANKIITTGEGGMITTNNKQLAELLSVIRDHGFSEDRHFWHRYRAFNYRMTNVQAAIGLAQTERFDHLVKRRIESAEWYDALLEDTPGLVLPPRSTADIISSRWMYGLRVSDEFPLSRDELRELLATFGIETRTFFVPVHLQPIYQSLFSEESYPVAEELSRRGLYLPSHAGLTKQDIQFIAGVINDIQRDSRYLSINA